MVVLLTFARQRVRFLPTTVYRLLTTARSAILLRTILFFLPPLYQNKYIPKPKNPSKTTPWDVILTGILRKNALENALFRHVFSQPRARPKGKGQRPKFRGQSIVKDQ